MITIEFRKPSNCHNCPFSHYTDGTAKCVWGPDWNCPLKEDGAYIYDDIHATLNRKDVTANADRA